jgi:hypothetical protein
MSPQLTHINGFIIFITGPAYNCAQKSDSVHTATFHACRNTRQGRRTKAVGGGVICLDGDSLEKIRGCFEDRGFTQPGYLASGMARQLPLPVSHIIKASTLL